LVQRSRAGFAGADPHGVLDRNHEDLAVADLAGAGGGLHGLHGACHGGVVDDRFQLYLRHEVHLVFGAAVDFGLTLLPAIAFDFRDRQTFNARLDQRFAHVVELEGFDDRNDEFHQPCRNARAPRPLIYC